MWKAEYGGKYQVLDLGRYCANVVKRTKRDRPSDTPPWYWQVSKITEKPCWTISALKERSEGYCKTQAQAMREAEARLREAGARFNTQA